MTFPRACQQQLTTRIQKLEHVQLFMDVDHNNRGDVEIFLTSPSGTQSKMLKKRSNDHSAKGINFVFMTVHKWGENPMGEWKVELCDNRQAKNTNTGNWNKYAYFMVIM